MRSRCLTVHAIVPEKLSFFRVKFSTNATVLARVDSGEHGRDTNFLVNSAFMNQFSHTGKLTGCTALSGLLYLPWMGSRNL